MSLKTKKVLGIDITISSKKSILEEIRKYLITENREQRTESKKTIKSLVIFTPNPEIIVYAQKDSNFARIVNSSQINIPDGRGVCWAARKIYKLKIKRITGVDLMENLCQMAGKQAFTIGLIGGRKAVALSALKCLQEKYANLKGWAIDGPEITIENSKFKIQSGKSLLRARDKFFDLGISSAKMKKIIDKIIKEKTDIVFVGLGHPKQEYFIQAISYLRPLVLMAVGGSFDYLAGRVPRAPKFIQDRGLEWLFRLFIQPWRLPRQLAGVKFFYQVLASKINTIKV